LRTSTPAELTLIGRTRDISEDGLSIIVSAGNIDRYLKQKENNFDVRLNLPDGLATFEAMPVHFNESFLAVQPVTSSARVLSTSISNSLRALKSFLSRYPPDPKSVLEIKLKTQADLTRAQRSCRHKERIEKFLALFR